MYIPIEFQLGFQLSVETVKLQILYQTYRPTQDLILYALLHSMNLYKITSVSNGWVSIQTRHVYNMIPLYQFSMIYCFMLYVQAWQVSLAYHASNSSSPAPTTPSRPPLPLGTLYIQCESGTQKKKLPPPTPPTPVSDSPWYTLVCLWMGCLEGILQIYMT